MTAMNQLGAIEYGGGSFFSFSVILSNLFMITVLGNDDELGRFEDSLLMLKALLVAPLTELCDGENMFDCLSKAPGSSFKASS